MNKIFSRLSGGRTNQEVSERKPRTSGSIREWCDEKLKGLGLEIGMASEYTIAIYRGNDAIGYYNSLGEIKAAIKDGSITENNK